MISNISHTMFTIIFHAIFFVTFDMIVSRLDVRVFSLLSKVFNVGNNAWSHFLIQTKSKVYICR